MTDTPRTTDDATAKTAAETAAPNTDGTTGEATRDADALAPKPPEQKPGEIGGPQGPEPTRYGDWEFKGRCTDF